MKSYEASSTIAAAPDAIWAIRTYSLTPQADGTTRFTMREEYTGPLLGMIWKSIPDLGPSFQQFADGLKARAESTS